MQTGVATYGSFKTIAPSDSTLVNCSAIYVGGAGSIVLSPDGVTAGITITAPPVGTILPIALEQGRVMAATTCTLLVALA